MFWRTPHYIDTIPCSVRSPQRCEEGCTPSPGKTLSSTIALKFLNITVTNMVFSDKATTSSYLYRVKTREFANFELSCFCKQQIDWKLAFLLHYLTMQHNCLEIHEQQTAYRSPLYKGPSEQHSAVFRFTFVMGVCVCVCVSFPSRQLHRSDPKLTSLYIGGSEGKSKTAAANQNSAFLKYKSLIQNNDIKWKLNERIISTILNRITQIMS